MAPEMNWFVLLLALAVIGVLMCCVLVALLWVRVESKRDRIDGIDRRVVVLEAHTEGASETSRSLRLLSHDVAALKERSVATQEMVMSIQEFLREKGR